MNDGGVSCSAEQMFHFTGCTPVPVVGKLGKVFSYVFISVGCGVLGVEVVVIDGGYLYGE
jgi:hypothetical protein